MAVLGSPAATAFDDHPARKAVAGDHATLKSHRHVRHQVPLGTIKWGTQLNMRASSHCSRPYNAYPGSLARLARARLCWFPRTV